jgi:hypothetical protein
VDCPKDGGPAGAEFAFTVTAVMPRAAGEGDRLPYQILWTGGSSNPLRHRGTTGQIEKVHARMTTGPATIVFTCPNREGLDAKVLETSFEVK